MRIQAFYNTDPEHCSTGTEFDLNNTRVQNKAKSEEHFSESYLESSLGTGKRCLRMDIVLWPSRDLKLWNTRWGYASDMVPTNKLACLN